MPTPTKTTQWTIQTYFNLRVIGLKPARAWILAHRMRQSIN